MSILRALNNLIHFYQFGRWGPAALLCILLGVLLQSWCLKKLQGKKRWLPLMIVGAAELLLEVVTDVSLAQHSFLALLFNGILIFPTALLLGILIPVLTQFIGTKVRHS